MVEVFKTDVHKREHSLQLVEALYCHFPDCRINFDLDDCDRVLRIEGRYIKPETVIMVINNNGFQCAVLE